MNTFFKLSTLSIALTTTAYAAETIPTYTGDEIVVTATRTPTPATQVIGDISVITREEINRAGQTTFAEMLQMLPGVQMDTNGWLGKSASLYIRGANSNHSLVLINGLRFNSATLGSTAIQHIPLSEIDRIEVLRAPASSLYGSDAIGGVVQLFTRQGKGEPALRASAGIGSYNTYRTGLGFSGENEKLRFNLQLSHMTSDGISSLSNTSSLYKNQNLDRDGYRQTQYAINLAHPIGQDHEISLDIFQVDANNHLDSYTSTFDAREQQRISAQGITLKSHFSDSWTSTLRAGVGTDKSTNIDATTTNNYRTDQHAYTWQNDFRTSAGTFNLSAERLQQELGGNVAYAVKERTTNSIIAGWLGESGPHQWQLNTRMDYNAQYGTHYSSGIGYGLHVTPKLRLSAAIGSAFKAPSFNDLYYPTDSRGSHGNLNLKPENSRNAELGLSYKQDQQETRLTWFDNHISDLIAWENQPSIGPYAYVPANIGKARIQGVSLAHLMSIGAYRVNAIIDWQDPRNTTTDKLLTRRAREHGSLSVLHHSGQWETGLEILASGRRFNDSNNQVPMGGYALLNLTASYAQSKELSFQGRINNLFDRNYVLAKDYSTPGITIYIGAKYEPR